jgi:hypothetical protein
MDAIHTLDPEYPARCQRAHFPAGAILCRSFLYAFHGRAPTLIDCTKRMNMHSCVSAKKFQG